jgi:signal transduction histidine kinase
MSHHDVVVIGATATGSTSRLRAAVVSASASSACERAQIVGGRLDVETSPGKGTSIFVHVPHDVPPGNCNF